MIQKESTASGTTDDALNLLGVRIDNQRKKSRDYLSGQKQRLDHLEECLERELTQIIQRLDEWDHFQSQVESDYFDVRKNRQELEKTKLDLEDRVVDIEQRESEVEKQRRRLERELESRRAELRDEFLSDQEQLSQQLTELSEELDRSQRAADEANSKVERLTVELSEQKNRSAQQLDSAKEALVTARYDEEKLREQLTQSRRMLNERAEQLQQARDAMEQLERQSHASAEGETADLRSELSDLRKHRDELQEELAKVRIEQANAAVEDADAEELFELRKRFEMAVEDVRELKTRNAELERHLKTLERATADAGRGQNLALAAANGTMDWETLKKQLLAQADNDLGIDDDHAPERNTVEDTIRTTEQVVARMEREIEELQSQLRQREDVPNVDLDELNYDAIVQQEREKLRKLQEEWHEKLRVAEVEIAVERAETARQRTDLQEKLRDLDIQIDRAKRGRSGTAPDTKKSGRRWLDRLGLSGNDDDE
ncbi:MAG: hypothetical protein R3E01_30425 [Pirellulaceae bacterium]|nr:hypothetical protein [Planctomycetales bacterium]MCA9265520.1 hypothetical protein [Planctomycetales bacterium]